MLNSPFKIEHLLLEMQQGKQVSCFKVYHFVKQTISALCLVGLVCWGLLVGVWFVLFGGGVGCLEFCCVCLFVSIKHKQLLPPYRFELRFHINNFGFC